MNRNFGDPFTLNIKPAKRQHCKFHSLELQQKYSMFEKKSFYFNKHYESFQSETKRYGRCIHPIISAHTHIMFGLDKNPTSNCSKVHRSPFCPRPIKLQRPVSSTVHAVYICLAIPSSCRRSLHSYNIFTRSRGLRLQL